MTVLDRKLQRDLARLWAQVLAIALVMGCGVATIIIAIGAYRSLDETRSAFYERYGFATVFARATRAPLSLRERLFAIDGVSAVELRIAKSIVLDIADMNEPATGVVLSLPVSGEPSVNRLYLRSGRWPDPTRSEIALIESFAKAHELQPGDPLTAILDGRKQTLRVSGIVLSPEFVYALGPGDMVPDPRRFAVLYMPRDRLEGVFDLEGAFNDVVLRTQRQAPIADVRDQVDRLLQPFGGTALSGG